VQAINARLEDEGMLLEDDEISLDDDGVFSDDDEISPELLEDDETPSREELLLFSPSETELLES
jgi:hypothetical protein